MNKATKILRQRSQIPTGFRPPAQGCEERGKGPEMNIFNPNGVATSSGCPSASRRARNPVGVENDNAMPYPGLLSESQPWALLRNPFGIEPALRIDQPEEGLAVERYRDLIM